MRSCVVFALFGVAMVVLCDLSVPRHLWAVISVYGVCAHHVASYPGDMRCVRAAVFVVSCFVCM